ncbi:enoyl-CoA hydratase/isomerase family protein [Actinomadura monticuli]|uniref:Enoyl-CoA hydratase/isomerase family protein n=1 Tax=Actinomadura monticuli TaxID=3097367 RepID=A0ABV4QHB4_9ACTN
MSTLELSSPEPGIALLTLSRPERLNALSAELLADLHRTLAAVAEDPEVRVVVLTGAGRGFCAGLDRAMVSVLGGPPTTTGGHRIEGWRVRWRSAGRPQRDWAPIERSCGSGADAVVVEARPRGVP